MESVASYMPCQLGTVALSGAKTRYRFLEHTADVGIEAWGPSFSDVLQEMAYGLTSLIFGQSSTVETTKVAIQIEAADRVELLVGWLNEIVFWIESNDVIPARFYIDKANECSLSAEISGEPFSAKQHSVEHQVKSVTYHQACVKETADGWFAQVFVDL